MKQVQACLSPRKSRGNSFHHCGGPVRLVQGCLNAGKVLKSCFNRRASDVKCHERPRKHFSPLWKSCEALFKSQERSHQAVLTSEEVLGSTCRRV